MNMKKNPSYLWPFLVLNDDFSTQESVHNVKKLVHELNEQGYDGVFIHPRPGLITSYLSDEWFEVVRSIIHICREIGMGVGLYDENTYPSGFAGGHVPSHCPQTVSRYIKPIFGTGKTAIPKDTARLYSTAKGVAVELISRDCIDNDTSWVAFVSRLMEPSKWHAGFPYVSLLDPQAMKCFLESTHEEYYKRLSPEDWDYLSAIFTDEPHLPGEDHGGWGEGIHWSPWIENEFERLKGYRLLDHIAELYWNLPGSNKTRYDYYETLHFLWVEHWAKPYQSWTKKHNIPLTGHYLEHDWPCPYATPGHMHLMKYLDWPGVDILESFLLEGHEGGDPQNLGVARVGEEPQILYMIKQAQSVANQYGKEKVMCEAWGAGGNDSRPADWLRIGRYMIVAGINFLVPHYAPVTIMGTRKTDHPQFFSPSNSAFPLLKEMNSELARLCEITSLGHMENRILVLDPQTTAFCNARKEDCLNLERTEDCWLTDTFINQTQASIDSIRKKTTAFAQILTNKMVDFDLGDEYLLEEDACVRSSELSMGNQSYPWIVLPDSMKNLRTTTLNILKEFLENGGSVFWVPSHDTLLDGVAYNWSDELLKYQTACPFENEGSMLSALLVTCAPRLQFVQNIGRGIIHQRRVLNDQVLYVILNTGDQCLESKLKFNEPGQASLYDSNTDTSEYTEHSTLSLKPGEWKVISLKKAISTEIPVEKEQIKRTEYTHKELKKMDWNHPLSILPESKNVLVLDTCSLVLDGKTYEEEHVYVANNRLWKACGIDNNGWFMLVQFEDRIKERIKLLGSYFSIELNYSFTIQNLNAVNDLEIAIENPDLWDIYLNDQKVDNFLTCWRDPNIKQSSICNLAKIGENHIQMKRVGLDPKCEIDAIYLLGTVGVFPTDKGFAVDLPQKLDLGSWKSQGMPFYDQSITYEYEVLESGEYHLILNQDQWNGSVIKWENANRSEITYEPHFDKVLHLDKEDTLKITVTGISANLWGPFRSKRRKNKTGWALDWHGENVDKTAIPGDEYTLMDLGICSTA